MTVYSLLDRGEKTRIAPAYFRSVAVQVDDATKLSRVNCKWWEENIYSEV